MDDWRYAARVRYDLWAHSPIRIDEESEPRRTRPHGANRHADREVYFDVGTESIEELDRALRDLGHAERVKIAVVEEGEACQNCGRIQTVLPTICPSCGHRDIDPCPHCGDEVPRQEYEKISGDLFRCPRCGSQVRLQLNPDLLNANLSLNEPVVVVSTVGA
ncbi:MAG TPA: hypothetical protein VNH11_15600 [Pirellulales bacterium]|nr:hypothetical protein [Pirellulales bacterium]